MKKLLIAVILLLSISAYAADGYLGVTDTTGSGTNTGNLYGYKRALAYVIPTADITVDTIYILVNNPSGYYADRVMGAIMRADTSLLGKSDSVQVNANSGKIWLALPMAGQAMKKDSIYFIGACAESLTQCYRLTSGSDDTTVFKTEAWNGTWDNPETGWTTSNGGKLWMYLAYTNAAAAVDTVTNASVDSSHSDYAIETDSIKIKFTMSSQVNDSVFATLATDGYPDSSYISKRKAYTASSTDSFWVANTDLIETDTAYVSIWVWDAVDGWSTRVQVFKVFRSYIDTVASFAADSIACDFEDNSDSVRFRYVTSSQTVPDSVFIAFSTSAYPDSSTINKRLAYTASATCTTYYVSSGATEPYTLFASIWVRDYLEGWSARKTTSIYFYDQPVIESITVIDTGATSFKTRTVFSTIAGAADTIFSYCSTFRDSVLNLSASYCIDTTLAKNSPCTTLFIGFSAETKIYFRRLICDYGARDTSAIDSITTLAAGTDECCLEDINYMMTEKYLAVMIKLEEILDSVKSNAENGCDETLDSLNNYYAYQTYKIDSLLAFIKAMPDTSDLATTSQIADSAAARVQQILGDSIAYLKEQLDSLHTYEIGRTGGYASLSDRMGSFGVTDGSSSVYSMHGFMEDLIRQPLDTLGIDLDTVRIYVGKNGVSTSQTSLFMLINGLSGTCIDDKLDSINRSVDSIEAIVDRVTDTLSVVFDGVLHVTDSIYAWDDDIAFISPIKSKTDSLHFRGDSTLSTGTGGMATLPDSLWEKLDSVNAAVYGITGAGSELCSLIVKDTASSYVADARIEVWSVDGSTKRVQSVYTNSVGRYIVHLDTGYSYKVVVTANLYNQLIDTITVHKDSAWVLLVTPFSTSTCNVTGTVYNNSGTLEPGAQVLASLKSDSTIVTYNDYFIDTDHWGAVTKTNSSGIFTLPLIPNSYLSDTSSTYTITIKYRSGNTDVIRGVKVPAQSTWDLEI